MLGEHNVQNCLATLAVCLEMGLDTELIVPALPVQYWQTL